MSGERAQHDDNLDRSRLLAVAEDLVDGRQPDWVAAGKDLDPVLVGRLRQIQTLLGTHDLCLTDRSATVPAGFAHLQIIERMGSGSGGAVYRAFDPLLQRQVALKLLHVSRRDDQRALQEAQRLACIDHPNVLKVHGAAIEAGQVGFWTDLVDGLPLQDWITRNQQPSPSDIAVIGIELCAALAAIHAAGLIHGDLKPANVLRHRGGRWVLVDFGSCVAHGEADSSGTPRYMAPERFEGNERPLPAVDIYSLGVLLFLIASGRHPIEGDDAASLRDAHRHGRRLHLLDLRPDLPAALVEAIETAMSADPSRRHASAGAFAAALPVALPPPGALPAPRRGQRRRLLGLGLGLAAALAIMALQPGFHRLPARGPATPELSLVKSAAGTDLPLRNGDQVAPGDALALRYRGSREAWVYVVNEDATGARFQLFPLDDSELTNPLPGGRDLRLPGRMEGRETDWQITSRGQRERFVVLIFDGPIEELESADLSQSAWGHPLHWESEMLAGGPRRGAGGLTPRDPPAANAPAAWLEALQARHPQLQVHRFELVNP